MVLAVDVGSKEANFTSEVKAGVTKGVESIITTDPWPDWCVLDGKYPGRALQEVRLATIQMATRWYENWKNLGKYQQCALVIE
jgi:hypothetical protein